MDFLNSLLPAIEHFHLLGYWIVLFVSILESLAFIGIIIPGTTFIVLIGFISAKGYLNLTNLIWFSAIGAIIGDVLSYYLGRHTKKFFKDDSRIFKSKYLDKGKSFFKKYGGRSIFLGRFIGPIRPIIPFVAGMFRMDRKKFLLWNIFSGFAWATTFLLIGFSFGEVWKWPTRESMFVTIFAGFIFILYLFRWMIIRKGKQSLYFLFSILNSIKKAIINNPDVQKLTKKHPIFFNFVKRRLSKNNFLGLPTTLLSLSFIYTFTLFVGIVENIMKSDIIISTDMRVANLLAVFRNADLTQFFLWITVLGKWQIILIFTLATIGILWIWQKRLYIAPLILSILGSETFTMLGKIAFHRSRPKLAVYTEPSFSFPSGHATIAIAFYGFLIYILIRNLKQWKTKVNLFFLGITIILLIGFSRLYLGVHYVSDVWGGYLIGTLWLIISISISEWLSAKRKKGVSFPTQTKTYVISIILILISLFSYTLFALNYHPQATSQNQIIQKEITIQNINNIFSNKNLKYTKTITGERQEPISFIILAKNDNKFIKIFSNSEWFLADKINTSSIIKSVKTVILKQEYHHAPITPSFWNGKTHNFGFEKPTISNTIRQRHHARFWKTNYVTNQGEKIYVGTVSLDSGIKWGITHKINPDIDTEREFLFNDLKNSNRLINFEKQKLVKPALGKNFSGDQFFTDGQAYIISIR